MAASVLELCKGRLRRVLFHGVLPPPNAQLHRRPKTVRCKLMLRSEFRTVPVGVSSKVYVSANLVAEFSGVLDEGDGLSKVGRHISGPRERPLDE